MDPRDNPILRAFIEKMGLANPLPSLMARMGLADPLPRGLTMASMPGAQPLAPVPMSPDALVNPSPPMGATDAPGDTSSAGALPPVLGQSGGLGGPFAGYQPGTLTLPRREYAPPDAPTFQTLPPVPVRDLGRDSRGALGASGLSSLAALALGGGARGAALAAISGGRGYLQGADRRAALDQQAYQQEAQRTLRLNDQAQRDFGNKLNRLRFEQQADAAADRGRVTEFNANEGARRGAFSVNSAALARTEANRLRAEEIAARSEREKAKADGQGAKNREGFLKSEFEKNAIELRRRDLTPERRAYLEGRQAEIEASFGVGRVGPDGQPAPAPSTEPAPKPTGETAKERGARLRGEVGDLLKIVKDPRATTEAKLRAQDRINEITAALGGKPYFTPGKVAVPAPPPKAPRASGGRSGAPSAGDAAELDGITASLGEINRRSSALNERMRSLNVAAVKEPDAAKRAAIMRQWKTAYDEVKTLEKDRARLISRRSTLDLKYKYNPKRGPSGTPTDGNRPPNFRGGSGRALVAPVLVPPRGGDWQEHRTKSGRVLKIRKVAA